ncbi:hypothetical protein BXY39_2275 [Eilatimonas milleporae]|uniref:Uncharacterized protein n=1 Tax=Eilatimonas milleporae TaxID=911205 RepID=A0A3M0CM92_9PROT|nr:hypothetical protein BXY39_2275 [Eilatimonas milleporae]
MSITKHVLCSLLVCGGAVSDRIRWASNLSGRKAATKAAHENARRTVRGLAGAHVQFNRIYIKNAVNPDRRQVFFFTVPSEPPPQRDPPMRRMRCRLYPEAP